MNSILRLGLLTTIALFIFGCAMKPMDHAFNKKVEQVKIGMTISQVRAIFPEMKRVGPAGSSTTYQYRKKDYRAISTLGIVEYKATFVFNRNRLVKFNTGK
jgi:hypothetical protein